MDSELPMQHGQQRNGERGRGEEPEETVAKESDGTRIAVERTRKNKAAQDEKGYDSADAVKEGG
jgi:hypothetical protein